MGSEAEVGDCRARWRLRSGLKQQLLKSGLGLCLQSNETFGNDQKKYIYGVKLIRFAEDIVSPRENLRKLIVISSCIRQLSDPCGDIRVVTFYPIVPAPSQILV